MTGSALLSIGTAVNSSTLLAALVTVPVAFAVVFAGVLGPNAASGMLGAMLSYVLPAASPGTISMIPDRLAGWWLASVAGTIAVLVLSPKPQADGLRAAVARMSRSLATQIRAALAGGADERGLDDCIAAKHDLLALFTSTPSRPLGLAAPDLALANAIELLEWCTSLILDALREHNDLRDAPAVDRALLDGAARTLLETAAMFEGARELPDLRGLETLREQSLGSVQDLSPTAAGFRHDAQIAFHAQAIATAVLAAGADAAVAERVVDSAWLTEQRLRYAGASSGGASGRLASAAGTAARHASVRSVWFINSVRAALALGAAVAVADLSSVQHGFWVVLGTLSVLRSNAASTGSTALRALGGTVIGFVIGGALLLAIGSETNVLWAVLPIAVFIAAYAPGTAPFAVGQAAFTVTVAVLFNLLAPVGWRVGILRVEDVAIGCAVSLLVGCMFWPRGVAAVVGDDLADAFRSGAGFLSQGVRWTSGLEQIKPDGATAAVTAGLRLDEALRGFLAEQGSKRIGKQELWRLVGGTLRLRLTAQALARLPPEPIAVREARDAIDRRAGIISDWYLSLAEQLDRPRESAISPLLAPTLGPDTVVGVESGSHYGVWLCEHLDHLAEHLAELIGPAFRIAELRRAPWWR